ncbi:MAG TPA: CDP-alcohol phosphatidyltransferase family protein [Terriglobales bacterium]|nr:CDP-alcohol phosphatidyltransferase family protein [Terriglobales bacterium]
MGSQLLTAPNQLTLMRLIFVPFIVINIVDGNYGWALLLFVIAGISDGLDGLLARLLKQKTVLGMYMDPIADKMLLSTLFLVLSIEHKIQWKFTVLVFSRDIAILITSALLYAVLGFRDFRPSIFGKMNTVAQIGAVFFVLVSQLRESIWVHVTAHVLLWLVFVFTITSGLHYVILTGQRLKTHDRSRPTAAP